MHCPGPAVPTPAGPLSFFYSHALLFFNIPLPHPYGPNGPLPSRSVFYSRAGPGFFLDSLLYAPPSPSASVAEGVGMG